MGVLDQLDIKRGGHALETEPTSQFRANLVDNIARQYDLCRDYPCCFQMEVGMGVRYSRVGANGFAPPDVEDACWCWMEEDGMYMCVYYNGAVLELAPGKSVIKIGPHYHLPQTLRLLKQAALAGELDHCARHFLVRRRVATQKRVHKAAFELIHGLEPL